MDSLNIDTKTGKLSLNGAELENVKDLSIKLHDDDRATVTIMISPCEIDAHIGIKNNRIAWIHGE